MDNILCVCIYIYLVDTVDEIFARREFNTGEYLTKKKVIDLVVVVALEVSSSCWCCNDDDDDVESTSENV